jgi:hypothetical protein
MREKRSGSVDRDATALSVTSRKDRMFLPARQEARLRYPVTPSGVPGLATG